MGEVVRAKDPHLAREVAIKLVRAGLHDSPGARERLAEEARTLAQLRHPNVISVFEAGPCEEGFYIAMELVDSGTLRDWLSQGPHSLDAILQRFIEAGRGLMAAHAAGLVHRDFKPDNVLIDDASGGAKVADFGLSFSSWSGPGRNGPAVADASETTTCTGTVLGTPAYMAPEQWRGRADARSDQYAYSIALYEALYGQRPDSEERVDDVAIPVRSARLGRLPRGLREALARGLRVSPAARFRSLAALVEVLQRVRRRHARRMWSRTFAAVAAVGVLPLIGVAADRWIQPELAVPIAAGVGRAERWLRHPDQVSPDDFAPETLAAIPLTRWQSLFRESAGQHADCGPARITEVHGRTGAVLEYDCEPFDMELAVAVEPGAPYRFTGIRILGVR